MTIPKLMLILLLRVTLFGEFSDVDRNSEVPEVFIIHDNDNAEVDGDDDNEQVVSVVSVDEVIDEYMSYDYQVDVADSTIKFLKRLKHESKRSVQKLHGFSMYCILLFNSKIDDKQFMISLIMTKSNCPKDEEDPCAIKILDGKFTITG